MFGALGDGRLDARSGDWCGNNRVNPLIEKIVVQDANWVGQNYLECINAEEELEEIIFLHDDSLSGFSQNFA